MTNAATPTGAHKSSIAIGDVLNGIFQIKRFIASGGMGEVFEGVNINTDEIVAVKIMAPAFAENPTVEAMFRNEARILTKLSHPALVQYRVLAREPNLNLLYIVMDFIDGVSLSDVIDSIGATTTEIISLTRRLANGLREAHKLGAIHRDLSPDNVLLERGRLERARIVDFGIAKNLNPAEGLTAMEGFSGKIGFAAPEQLGDYGGAVGPWTDVYGLGLMILSLALGRKFSFGNIAEQAIAKRREPIDLSLIQPELRPLLQAMLVADPAARLRSMDAVLEVIDDANYQKTLFALPDTAFAPVSPAPAADKPVDSRPLSLVQQLNESAAQDRKARGLRRGMAVAAALAAVAAAGGYYYYAKILTPTNSLIAARNAVASENCSWLVVDAGDAAKGSGSFIVRGAANDPAAVKSSVAAAIGSAGGPQDAAVDVSGVGSLDPAACELVDTIRTMRSDRGLLTTEKPVYRMLPDGAPTLPGKVAARTIETVDISGGGKPFSLYKIMPDGRLEWLMDRSSIPDMVKADKVEMVGADRLRLKLDIDREGWLGLLMVAGQQEERTKLWTVPVDTRTKAWYEELATEASKNGWHADMVWFSATTKA